jgi:competence/damage-inducible protein CinA-like protein
MPSAEIITIGTEILLGEIVDTNARYIARQLRDLGIDLYRKTTVGDNANRISQALQQAMDRCEIIITTGGLGPTIDDPTRQAVAQAVDAPIEFHPELWEQIQARFKLFNRQPTENNRRQAYIPAGAQAILNPVGTAPAFLVEKNDKLIIALPGVPREMEYILEHSVLPILRERYQLHGLIKTRILHTVGVGESQIDDLIGDLEILSNPTVGLAAHSGQVDVRITVKANSKDEADELILGIEQELRGRIGAWIYGADEETLEEVVFERFRQVGWTLAVIEYGIGGRLIQRLSRSSTSSLPTPADVIKGGEVITKMDDPSELSQLAASCKKSYAADCCLGVAIIPGEMKVDIHIVLITPEGEKSTVSYFGGPLEYAARYAINSSLNTLLKV